jgi:hypothetical protein
LCAAETLRGCCSPHYCCDIKNIDNLYSDSAVVIHCVLQKHCGVAAHHNIVVILKTQQFIFRQYCGDSLCAALRGCCSPHYCCDIKNIDNLYSDSAVVIHCVLQKHCGVAAHHNIVVILKTQQFIFRQYCGDSLCAAETLRGGGKLS